MDLETVKQIKEGKRKLRILACPANTGGCAYYRIILPMNKMLEKMPDKVEIRFSQEPLKINVKEGEEVKPENIIPCDDMKWADIIFTQNIHNRGGPYTAEILQQAHKMGKFTHFDTDDLLTDLYDGHRLVDVYHEHRLSDVTKIIYANADCVSVTQAKFAERVQPFVKKALVIIKNQIDFDLQCWNLTRYPMKKPTRIGWVGGIHHEEDVKEFTNVALALNERIGVQNIQWGFYGKPPVDPTKGPDWQQDVWDNYAKILGRGLVGKKKNYQVYPAMNCDQYGAMYTNIDIAIAPLQYNEFNDSKSEIKLMECGRYGIPLVASNVGCYDEIIKNGETGYLVSKDNNKKDWVRVLTKLIKDFKLRNQMGANLKKIVDERFDINKHINERYDLYVHLLEIKAQAMNQVQNTGYVELKNE